MSDCGNGIVNVGSRLGLCKTSKYIGVSFCTRTTGVKSQQKGEWYGSITYSGHRHAKIFKTEREAALWYDIQVIENNLDRPLNILKRR